MTLPSPPPDGDFVRIVEVGPRDGLQRYRLTEAGQALLQQERP